MNTISSKDISVVVQGPIVGSSKDPYESRLTYLCLKSIRQYLPKAEIILSTWKGSDTNDLIYDILLENDDPGVLCYPAGISVVNNVNRQIVSSRNGLLKATRAYTLKLRSDMLLDGTNFLSYYHKYDHRCDRWKVLNNRVVISTIYSRNPNRSLFPYPFHPSDWFLFGEIKDVLNIFDIPLAQPEIRELPIRKTPVLRSYRGSKTDYFVRYTPEQYIWVTFLRKYAQVDFDYQWDTSNSSVEISELVIANNLILLEPEQSQIKFLKYQITNLDRYSTYSHGEWLRLYKRYCDPAEKEIFDYYIDWTLMKGMLYFHFGYKLEKLFDVSAAKDNFKRVVSYSFPGLYKLAKRYYK